MVDKAVDNWGVIFLGIISLCSVLMTGILLFTAVDLRRFLQEARQTLKHARHILIRTDKTTLQAEEIIHKACSAFSEILGQFTFFKERAQHFWADRFPWLGNGVRVRRRQYQHTKRNGIKGG